MVRGTRCWGRGMDEPIPYKYFDIFLAFAGGQRPPLRIPTLPTVHLTAYPPNQLTRRTVPLVTLVYAYSSVNIFLNFSDSLNSCNVISA